MQSSDFLDKSKQLVVDLVLETEGVELLVENIVYVWYSKTLKNHKVILTDLYAHRQELYEVTYNGELGEFYVDVYTKQANKKIKI